MRMSIRSTVVAAVLAVPAMQLSATRLQAADDAADIVRGRQLYDSFGCYQCHGHYGQGGNAGPKIAPGPLPYEAFRVFVRMPVARMPPYTDQVLSEDQLQLVHRYLQSLEPGPPPAEIHLLDGSIQAED